MLSEQSSSAAVSEPGAENLMTNRNPSNHYSFFPARIRSNDSDVVVIEKKEKLRITELKKL